MLDVMVTVNEPDISVSVNDLAVDVAVQAMGAQGPAGPPGAGGAPSTADYLVGTANGSLSAEIVVGTSPGGEFGGTWASPTVATVHSGSSHAATQAAAEATAAFALASHEADTTVVHGIANTANLVLTSDNRLSDARTPTGHATSHQFGGSDALALAESQVTNLVTDLAAKIAKTDYTQSLLLLG